MSLILTTSRNPSIRTRQFLREFSLLFPSKKVNVVNRGKLSLQDLFLKHSSSSVLCIVSSYHGNPNKLSFFIKKQSFFEWSMDFKIKFIKLHFELNEIVYDNPHRTLLIFKNINRNLSKLLSSLFKYFSQSLNNEDNIKIDRDVVITFSHENPGFLLTASLSNNYNKVKIGPQIMISEIIVNDD